MSTETMDELEAALRKFVAFPSEDARVAVALWVMHAHAVAAAESTPRLAILSAQKQSGKSRLLEVLELLVPRALFTTNTSTSALFRAIDSGELPTVLLDEVDTIFNPFTPNDELRGLINSGHRRSGYVLRSVGEGTKFRTVKFSTYAAMALAGIGDLPDTVHDRSVVVRMRRRIESERVSQFRRKYAEAELVPLRDQLEAWATEHHDQLDGYEPEFPLGITDRPADVWEPLLAIAEVFGGDWPARGRRAASVLTDEARADDESVGTKLLDDIRTIFESKDDRRLETGDLVFWLNNIDESPWGDWKGHRMTARGLAELLRPYRITPDKWREGKETQRGYLAGDFEDAWARYLPSPSVSVGPPHAPHVPRVADASATDHETATHDACNDSEVSGVADVAVPHTRGRASVADAEPVADRPATGVPDPEPLR